jgi:hypothetical protein
MYLEKNPSSSVKRCLNNTWKPQNHNVTKTNKDVQPPAQLALQEKSRFKMAQLMFARGARRSIKEDKTMVGYTPTAFLHSPLIQNQFKGYENRFVLTTGKDFVGVCNFTSFQDMDPKIFNHFNKVTQILTYSTQSHN